MIKRELYLKKIRPFYDNELIKVIMGVRRCGKSILLKQIIEELKENKVDDSRIIYMNLEDLQYGEIKNEMDLYNYITPKLTADQKYYLFFDEIQLVDNFEKAINSFRSTNDVSIFVTGSNGNLLSGELATLLSGRYVSFRMMPFTFKEMCEVKGYMDGQLYPSDNLYPSETLYPNGIDEQWFLDYVEWGGMPQIFSLNTDEEKSAFLQDIYNSITLKDIITRYKIKDIDLLNKIIQFMMENVGGIFSANSIRNYLKQEALKIAPNTIYNYVEYIISSLLLDKVNRYAIKGKSVLATLEKYYLVDMGILQSKKSSIEKKVGGRLENIIYNELIARGYKVHIGKTEKGEIDFVVDNFGEISYIQVADYLSSDEVIAREFNAFDEVKDNFPKYVLTMDKIDYSRKGIKHINIVDFLLHHDL